MRNKNDNIYNNKSKTQKSDGQTNIDKYKEAAHEIFWDLNMLYLYT